MKRIQHTRHCRKILGQGFPQVHNYLDQFADKLGPAHRDMLHNERGIKHCINHWGYLAGAAACLHIWADQEGVIETEEGNFEPAVIINEKRIQADKEREGGSTEDSGV